ncbi:hypothetical protein PRZ48_009252 [Zasmidium cellare]|uniref:SnoaL-like domain-containing protein n=1 Tax=Zasmidium cellare TaxID=395010 RepID=A0ABR0EB74_ZASCE|nr:hypothetical protein PRZ48_009252 [Zasmidium cellare]
MIGNEELPKPQTSLDILAPPSTGADTAPAAPYDSTLAQELMDLSHICIQDVNSRAVYAKVDVPPFIAPDFKAVNSGHPDSTSYHEFLSLHREFAEIHPEYHVKVLNTSIDMDERSGHASVFMLIEILGRPADTRRGAVVVWKWKKRFGRWLLFKQAGIRGMCGVLEDGYIQGKGAVRQSQSEQVER